MTGTTNPRKRLIAAVCARRRQGLARSWREDQTDGPRVFPPRGKRICLHPPAGGTGAWKMHLAPPACWRDPRVSDARKSDLSPPAGWLDPRVQAARKSDLSPPAGWRDQRVPGARESGLSPPAGWGKTRVPGARKSTPTPPAGRRAVPEGFPSCPHPTRRAFVTLFDKTL